jgi:hypothetical protein
VGLWERLFSNDYRAAVAAEAAGDLELAAERYVLAGHPDAASRIHLLRAERATSRQAELDALRDALHWARSPDATARARRGLGLAMLARARAEGVATERDRARLREAAGHLLAAGEHRAAADAALLVGDDETAAAAFGSAGLVDHLEDALERDAALRGRAREVREAWADYEVAQLGGERDAAVAALRRCVAAADDKAEYRRALDDLEGRLLVRGAVHLALRRGGRVVVSTAPRVVLGRDALGDVALRSAGVSRQHAVVRRDAGGYALEDLGSKNGTRLGGLTLAGALPLVGAGGFALGDACEIGFRLDGAVLRLSIERGLDRGLVVLCAPPDAAIDLAVAGLAATLRFVDGRPRLGGAALDLGGRRVAQGDVQLVIGDQLVVGGIEAEVAG